MKQKNHQAKESVVNIRIRLLLFSFLILNFSFAFAQTATEMDTLLASDTVSVAKAARFVLGAADLLPAGLSGAEAEKAAYDKAKTNGWINAASGEAVTMKDAAFLIMQAFDMKGGVMYSLFESPRYAYREMVYRKLISGRSDQAMKVSGQRLLLILDKVINRDK